MFLRLPRGGRPSLKGTRYHVSLPRGGRDAPGPVLREDVYLDRMKRLRPRLGHGTTREDAVGAVAAYDPGYDPLAHAPTKELFVREEYVMSVLV